MDKCSHCRQRKAKRHCRALGSGLCPLCCGVLREKTLHCPPACPYLAKHRPYQETRVIQKKQTYSADITSDERLSWLLLHIEAALRDYGERKPEFSDKDAVLALEYAGRKVAQGRQRLLLPREENAVKNEAGEAIFQSIEQCRYERQIVLPQEMAGYKAEEKLKCLENVILAVKFIAQRDLRGRDYIEDVKRRFERLRDVSSRKKIVSPT